MLVCWCAGAGVLVCLMYCYNACYSTIHPHTGISKPGSNPTCFIFGTCHLHSLNNKLQLAVFSARCESADTVHSSANAILESNIYCKMSTKPPSTRR